MGAGHGDARRALSLPQVLHAVALAAIGYGEGALLSRELSSWQTICWALIVALPVMLPLMLAGLGSGWPEADAPA
ncbi:hypothetical protein [Cryobacterium sp. SO1]|uniref:hypothetical protein n=1 Tax=Cryobacterium sp. SO1 TaxID=1897061 RepID=UPI0010F03A88|nr:hypothetical protein [Cryobacterium sp. SO1]RZI34100.1 hypothetical protein BJQ95_03563 [Cryobacterium sp. SO1]